MRLLGLEKIKKFIKAHPQAKTPLGVWQKIIKQNKYRNFVELKRTFPRADYVKPYTIFDISGNKFRLVVIVTYVSGAVLVKEIFTHAEYDKWNKRR